MTREQSRFERLGWIGKTGVLFSLNVVVALLLFGLSEGALRLRQALLAGTTSGTIEEIYRFDDELGIPVAVAGYRSGNISINSLGFRGPEIPATKPEDTIRIAFFGGSAAFCADVSGNRQAWPDIVTRTLQAKYGSAKFDYVNASLPGYTVQSSLINLRHRVALLKPDIIVIYHATNDLSRNSRNVARELGWRGANGDNQLSWLSHYSLLSYLVEKNYWVLQAQMRAEDAARAADSGLRLPLDAVSAPFKKDLEQLAREARSLTRHVVLVTFSAKYRPEQPAEERAAAAVNSLYYMPYMTLDGLIAHVSEYNRRIVEVGEELGLTVIGGEDAIPGTDRYFVDSVHFTDAGSTWMAERVVQHLIDRKIVDGLIGVPGSS